jgi:amidase
VPKIIPNAKVIYSFKPDLKPVEIVKAGNTVLFETMDALGEQLKSETDTLEHLDFSTVNPATGPIYVKNLRKGDALEVKILDIKLPEKGVMVISPGHGALPEMVGES